MKKKTWSLVAGIALSSALLFGCSQDGEIKNVKLSQEQQEMFVSTFIDKAHQETEPSELVKELNKNIAGLEEKQASDSVDALLYSMYQYKDDMNGIIKGLQPMMEKYKAEGIDFNNPEDIEKIDDKMLKAFLEQTQSRLLLVTTENQQYIVVADFDKILSQYESFMAEDIKAMVKFSKEEFEVKYYDEEKQKMNLDVLSDRIVLMDGLVEKHPDSYYANWFGKSKSFYYQLYFGMNGNSITKKDQTLLPDVEAHFQTMIQKHEGTEFAKNISLFFEEYQKNGNKLNDNVYVFLLDMTGKEHQSMVEEGTAGQGENDQVKDAIKKAIEETKTEGSEE